MSESEPTQSEIEYLAKALARKILELQGEADRANNALTKIITLSVGSLLCRHCILSCCIKSGYISASMSGIELAPKCTCKLESDG